MYDALCYMTQVQGSPGRPVLYSGFRNCFASVWRTEGPAAFYRGSLFSFMKVGTSLFPLYLILFSNI